jgi:hypothetical protein
MMDNLGGILGPLLAIALAAAVGIREAILLSIIPRPARRRRDRLRQPRRPTPQYRERQPIRIKVRHVLHGELGRLGAVGAFELGNIAATLLILRATDLLRPEHGTDQAAQLLLTTAQSLGNFVASSIASLLWTSEDRCQRAGERAGDPDQQRPERQRRPRSVRDRHWRPHPAMRRAPWP